MKFQNKNINDILRSEFIIKLLNKISNNDRIIASTGFNSRELFQLRNENRLNQERIFI